MTSYVDRDDITPFGMVTEIIWENLRNPIPEKPISAFNSKLARREGITSTLWHMTADIVNKERAKLYPRVKHVMNVYPDEAGRAVRECIESVSAWQGINSPKDKRLWMYNAEGILWQLVLCDAMHEQNEAARRDLILAGQHDLLTDDDTAWLQDQLKTYADILDPIKKALSSLTLLSEDGK